MKQSTQPHKQYIYTTSRSIPENKSLHGPSLILESSGQIALGQYKAFLAELYPAYVENIPALGQERVCRHIYDAVSSVNYHVRQLILRRVVHAVSADMCVNPIVLSISKVYRHGEKKIPGLT